MIFFEKKVIQKWKLLAKKYTIRVEDALEQSTAIVPELLPEIISVSEFFMIVTVFYNFFVIQ